MVAGTLRMLNAPQCDGNVCVVWIRFGSSNLQGQQGRLNLQYQRVTVFPRPLSGIKEQTVKTSYAFVDMESVLQTQKSPGKSRVLVHSKDRVQ